MVHAACKALPDFFRASATHCLPLLPARRTSGAVGIAAQRQLLTYGWPQLQACKLQRPHMLQFDFPGTRPVQPWRVLAFTFPLVQASWEPCVWLQPEHGTCSDKPYFNSAVPECVCSGGRAASFLVNAYNLLMCRYTSSAALESMGAAFKRSTILIGAFTSQFTEELKVWHPHIHH